MTARRRITALAAAAALVVTAAGGAGAATKAPTRHTATPVRTTKAAHPTKTAAAPADATCGQEIADGAQVMSGDALDALNTDATDLAGQTTLRIRTVTSVPGGNLNAYEKTLQIRCGWADGANVRQPRLLVLMVTTQDRQMGIYPGPDLVGTITDQAWLSIEQQNMRPLLADGDWSGGLQAGVDALDALLTSGAPDAVPAESAAPTQPSVLQYDANGNLIQGDGSAQHPFVNTDLGQNTNSFPTVAVMIFVVMGAIAVITLIRSATGGRRRRPYDSSNSLNQFDPGPQPGGHHGGHHGGFFGGDGGYGGGGDSGGGSSSDGGGGSSGF